MEIRALASTISDNFFYLVLDDGDALLIDPFDARLAIETVRDLAPDRVRVFTTHGHPDHCGGNAMVKEALGCEVIASAHASMFPVEADRQLRDGDELTVGATTWQVRWAPGHTDGHLALHHEGHLISGDVYFVGGSGHCKFGGDPDELYRTFAERLADVPDDTTFYPGHDYAARNLEFCLSVEPDNAGAAAFATRLEGHTRADGPVLTTLGHERSYNPFHRAGDPELQQRLRDLELDVTDARTAFKAVRALRDRF